ncbi:MAG: O-antigen ligase domain-containing protein [Phycisphaerae bacterium]|jgi:hypothetical protein
MNAMVSITLFGWIPAVLIMFITMPPRRAVVVSFLAAWMFLPMGGFRFEGIPEINKMSVTCVGALLGSVIFDPSRLFRIKISPWDVPIIVWILAPLPSAVANGYGAYEGFSLVFSQAVSWGLPYLLGRLYFSDLEGLRELAMGFLVGGLVYVPLVLFEARMSPQLHTWVYGFHQHEFLQSRRGDSWRPTVFMQHGLAVAMFMGTAALCAFWFWIAERKRGVRELPMWVVVAALYAAALICRSTYALMLMTGGTAVLFVSRRFRSRLALAAMVAVAPLYVLLRTLGGWDAQVMRWVANLIETRRLESLDTRLQSEDICWHAVQSSMVFGLGRIDGIVMSRDGKGFIPDGLWLIALGRYGFVGLAAMLAALLVPVAVYLNRHSPRTLFSAPYAGATAMAMVITLYAMDNLLNAMINPVYLLGAGGLLGLPALRVRRPAFRPVPLVASASPESLSWSPRR